MTTVVNKKYSGYDFYCGRGSIFGNPYVIGRDGTREQVIERYREWFQFLLKDAYFVSRLNQLKNKKLGCFCKEPYKEVPCHADVIAEYLNSYEKN